MAASPILLDCRSLPRAPEGIIEPASENAERGARRRANISASYGVGLASVYSTPMLLADSSSEPKDRTAALAQGCGLGIIHEFGREMLKEEDLEHKSDLKIAALTIFLGARGYSAKQILEAILLDSYQFRWGEGSSVDSSCDYIEYSPGVILRPAYPPANFLTELSCPGADSDAPTEFPTEAVQAAVARAKASHASSDEAQATTTTIANPDVDGIKDGLYVGEVFIAGEARTLVDEIVDSTVELDITDEGIVAVVEYVHRYSAVVANGRTVCVATFRILYSGQGPVTSPLSLVLEPVEGEIVSVEGECGDIVREGIHSHLASQGQLAGTFDDGVFNGQLDAQRGVRASIAE